MKIAFITDEMTQSFDEALEFAVQYKLDGLELRSVHDTPIDSILETDLREMKQRLDQHALVVPVLASSFYKCEMDNEDVIAAELEKLERLCVRADILDSRYIRGFTFFHAGPFDEVMPKILPYFDEPIKMLERYDKILLLEADPSVNGTNHREIAAFIKSLGSDRVRAIFDPGNSLYDPKGEVPVPDGYHAIKDVMEHVHIKDVVITKDGPECVKVGTGKVSYKSLLERLVEDRYDGWLSLETHYRSGIVLTEEQMRIPQGSIFSKGGYTAMHESLESLRELLENARRTVE